MVLDLVGGRNNSSLGQEFLEVLDTIVGDTDGLDLFGANELLHTLPGSDVRVIVNDIPGAILELGEERVVACGELVSVWRCCTNGLHSPLGFMARGQCIR